ncbi:CshA/CshB family fibrillar adhesin-related protein [Myroides sp. LJL119]
MKVILYTVVSTLCFLGQSVFAQEIPTAGTQSLIPESAFVTAAFATGGQSEYLDTVLWLTWGAKSSADKYGKDDQRIANGASSYARIDLGDNKLLEISATISDIEYYNGSNWVKVNDGSRLKSYRPGNYHGDFLDKLYNIGGVNAKNQLINGLSVINDGNEVRFKVTCKAVLDGKPIRLSGMVLGDAESMASNENADASAYGQWTIVDIKQNLGNSNEYLVKKTNLKNGKQKLDFLKGNDSSTGAVGFMTFSEQAYDEDNGFQVTFDARLKGGGKQAIALGLIPPALDGGDAPESYGAAWHLLEGFMPGDDGIQAVNEDEPEKRVNINTKGYTPGGLVAQSSGYLGSTPPDSDSSVNYSRFADADDKEGVAGLDEEDAWPLEYRITDRKFYRENQTFSAKITYVAKKDGMYIAGWIDLNDNGVFDQEERVVVPAPRTGDESGSVELSWNIPSQRTPVGTFVRLRMADNQADIQTPIGIAKGGEVEDHRIYVISPTITNPMLPSKRDNKAPSTGN